MKYLHNQPNWPNLTWDLEALSGKLLDVRHKQGRHLGKMEALGFELKTEANMAALTDEIVKTSAIEGENLNTQEVRSSIARKLGVEAAGLPTPSRQVNGIVEMMIDATRNFSEPLTKDRLFSWHKHLFSAMTDSPNIRIGIWRNDEQGPMQVVSGPLGREMVHFEAPSAERIDEEMISFLAWYNLDNGTDLVIKSAVSHLRFVTIHPFDDGNGRITRAISEMTLSRSDKSKDRFYSMSSQIMKERKDYYMELEYVQKGGLDVTSWLDWYIGCLGRAIDSSDDLLQNVLHKSKFWQRLSNHSINERQSKIINLMLDDFKGFMSTSKYSKLSKCSSDTSLRDIQDLVNKGVFIKNPSGGRSTSYRLASLEEFQSSR